jgi:hypothetical protein
MKKPGSIYSLVNAIDKFETALSNLRTELSLNEQSRDHNHGNGAIREGGPCGYGDDCRVAEVRRILRRNEIK